MSTTLKTSTDVEFGQGNMDEGHGGSPFGASTIEGRDGSREPSELELKLARFQGEHCGRIHLQSSFVAGASTYHGSVQRYKALHPAVRPAPRRAAPDPPPAARPPQRRPRAAARSKPAETDAAEADAAEPPPAAKPLEREQTLELG